MENKLYLLSFICFLLVSMSSFGQNDLNFPDKRINQYSNLYELVLFSEESITISEPQTAASDNQIFIQQIGDNNYINSNIRSRESNLDLIQLGNNNFTSIETVVNSVQGSILQDGNNNFYSTTVQDPDSNMFPKVNMKGNNHHFESHGTNSIGNKMQFNITGDAKTIIVRNFK